MVSLDACFLIDLLHGDPAAAELAARLEASGEPTCVTPPASVEVLAGETHVGGKYVEKARELISSLHRLEFDDEAIETTSRLAARLIEKGERLGEGDLFIAGISLRHRQRLITRDRGFARVPGLEVEFY